MAQTLAWDWGFWKIAGLANYVATEEHRRRGTGAASLIRCWLMYRHLRETLSGGLNPGYPPHAKHSGEEKKTQTFNATDLTQSN